MIKVSLYYRLHIMASRRRGFTDAQFAKWIKAGRGAGEYASYQPWLKVSDFPSLGRVHRVFGHKSQRTHHLLSDLELSVFLLLEWHREVMQIREQFPLEREVTRRLASEAMIDHPALAGTEQYLSSDFLVDSSNEHEPRFALQVKYKDALDDARTVEKLELERRYWQEKGVPWYLVTEADIPATVSKNISWLYPSQRNEQEDSELTMQQIDLYAHHFAKKPNQTVHAICKELDAAYDLPLGESLFEIRTLLAKRYFTFDLFVPVSVRRQLSWPVRVNYDGRLGFRILSGSSLF